MHADADCVAFMDIHPVSEGHVLVVPRRHAGHLGELSGAEQARLFQVASAVRAAQVRAGLGREGANLLLNDGPAANQHVPHVHLHVVPREAGDTARVGWRVVARMGFDRFGGARRRDRLEAAAAAIRAALEVPPAR